VENQKNIARVSVVIPCYRCADTIERAVMSVAEQTLKPYEVILVEDCSGDYTLDVLYSLQSQFDVDWIKIIPLKVNSGPGTARNVGWNASQQDYIAFLDADDSWHPQKIEIQYGWMVKNPDVDMTGHDFQYLKTTDEFIEKHNVGLVDFLQVTKKALVFKNRFSTPSVMLKSTINNRFPSGKKYCEDYYLWTEIAFNESTCYFANTVLAFLHKPPYGISGLSADLWEMEKGELDVYRNLYNKGLINVFQHAFFTVFSTLKFIRRIFS